MPISIKNFDGEYPRTLPHLLPDNAAQDAVNCDFTQNSLTGLRVWKEISHNIPWQTLLGSHESIFAYKSKLFVFPSDSDICRSPVADDKFDRLYWTQTYPGYEYLYVCRDASFGFPQGGLVGQVDLRISRAGVPAPVVAPTVSNPEFNINGLVFVSGELFYETDTGETYGSPQALWGKLTSYTPTEFFWNYPWSSVVPSMTISTTKQVTSTEAVTEIIQNQVAGEWTEFPKKVTTVTNATETKVYKAALRATFGKKDAAGNIISKDLVLILRQDASKSSSPMSNLSGGISISSSNTMTASLYYGALQEERYYVYTFVNIYGEEGPPSPPVGVTISENSACSITIPGAASSIPPNSGFPEVKAMRLYRSATGSSGTNFLFVDEVATGSTTTYMDLKKSSELGEVISTIGSYPPVRYLKGLCQLPNGVLAAFRNNEIWFSDPYLPYSWNPNNTLTTLEDIVSICPAEGGLYVTTKGHPYFVSGVTPDAMSQIKLTSVQAGTSKNGICNMGPAVVWASHDGLVTARGIDAGLDWSYKFFTRAEWRDRYGSKLDKIRLNAHDGHLVVTFTDGTPGFVMRFDESNPTFSKLGYGFTAMNTWTTNDALIGITYSSGEYKIVQFAYSESGYESTENFSWTSKDFILPKPVNFGVMQLVGVGNVTVSIYADGALKHTKSVSLDMTGREILRLPSGFKARRWSFKVSGNGRVEEVNMAISPRELQGA